MNSGKTVFAQLMDFIPAHEFRRCVTRYGGHYRVRSFSCWDQFLSMAFAQLTYRESLRDIETCLRALGGKLYHLGIRGHISRSTLADANETRDWRIFADLARVLIATARPLYAGDPLGVELEETAYALDCTMIDLCLSLFPWARYRRLHAAVKMTPSEKQAAQRRSGKMPGMPIERERLDADVLIIGAGSAGLSCALHLANLIERHNLEMKSPALSAENIYVLEKAREIGAHQLSGAMLDPRALRELVPDFEKSAPLDTPVKRDAAYFLTRRNSWKLPITPPPLRNHGNYVISLNRFVKWLAQLVEKKAVNIFAEFAGQELLYEGNGITGVLSGDKGVDKYGKPKDNFTPGYELHAKVTVLAEGPRGSLAKDLVSRLKLDGSNPQVYGIGIKELWEVEPGRIDAGCVAHTLGWPLGSDVYGGGWIYGMRDNRVSVGMVVGLEYSDPLFDPHEAFQKFKTHPFVRRILDGGKVVRYGAKTVPYGGWYSMPRNYVDGGLIIGDSASLLNSQRLKGIHTAMKSGMLAAETIYKALCAGDTSAKMLAAYSQKIENSWIKKELWPVRNFHQGFHDGLGKGLAHAALQFFTGGRGLVDLMRAKAGHEMYRLLHRDRSLVDQSARFKGDGKLTFDRLTDVYHSGTRHEEDQPCHLVVLEPNICGDRCVREYGNPCQYFCPAAVYEMVTENGAPKLKINASNCVHCKTCDIADPYQIINWVPPEGGGGPNYEGM